MMIRRLIVSSLLVSMVIVLFGCTASRAPSHSRTLEGEVTVRGHEPFTAVILQTRGRNYYILKLSIEQRRVLITPAPYRVTGRLYMDDWNGRSYAHLEVVELLPLDPY